MPCSWQYNSANWSERLRAGLLRFCIHATSANCGRDFGLSRVHVVKRVRLNVTLPLGDLACGGEYNPIAVPSDGVLRIGCCLDCPMVVVSVTCTA